MDNRLRVRVAYGGDTHFPFIKRRDEVRDALDCSAALIKSLLDYLTNRRAPMLMRNSDGGGASYALCSKRAKYSG
jgi:hypothetical protein